MLLKLLRASLLYKARDFVAKCRLDEYLVSAGFCDNTAEALRMVMARKVKVNDVYVSSAAISIKDGDSVWVRDCSPYVSRGGLKLAGALREFNFDCSGLKCVDIGSSTGGFTDCLLQEGAASVACVDVNYGQLAWSIRVDERVRVFERTNIKLVTPAELGAPFDLLVADLSFIGLASLAGVFANLCERGSVFLGLIKPQFESRHDETVGGVVVSEDVRLRVVNEVRFALEQHGFNVEGVVESSIKGPAGNVEYVVKAVYL